MIVFPKDWAHKGQAVSLDLIEETIFNILERLDPPCHNLSLSGGVDSSYMLYCMTKVYGNEINTYTITEDSNHPDFIFSKEISDFFGVRWIPFTPYLIPDDEEIPAEDRGVKLFYNFLENIGIEGIITGDGIDELMAGYYAHQTDPSETVYYDHLRLLYKNHLEPLNKNSGKVKVHLPYLDNSLILLLSQIPLSEKVDRSNRKKIMTKLSKGKIPDEIINRRKLGFCSALSYSKKN